MMYYLYRHIRPDSGQPFYIGVGKKFRLSGSDSTIYARAYSTNRRSLHWKRIFNKHGREVEILFETDDLNLIREKEKEFILLHGRRDLNTGPLINRNSGDPSLCGPETRKLLSDLHKGKAVSAETRRKISLAQVGRTHSEETKRILMLQRKGIPLPRSLTIAAALKRMKPVEQCSISGGFIKIWDSIISAAKDLNIDRSDITKCCKNSKKTAGGFKWRYRLHKH